MTGPGATADGNSVWARQYPPMVAIVVALLIAVFALPSALNLPQANPSQTLEYAPVPPDKNNAPPGGSLSSLGLGTSSTVGENGNGSVDANLLPPPPLRGTGGVPSDKDCVGNPPRQTEDPLSPPCVAYFGGDNGGATYPGVTGQEIRIVYYVQDSVNADGQTYLDGFYDLDQPPNAWPDAAYALRGLEVYFNGRFQTYKRHVHFYLHVSSSDNPSPTTNREAAATDFQRAHPFAALTFFQSGDESDYLHAMADRGVLNFGSAQGRDAAFYRGYPGLIWGYLPTVDLQARQFSSLLCKAIFNRPVKFSGDGNLGAPRKVGLLYPDNPSFPGMLEFTKMVENGVKSCGGSFFPKHAFADIGYTVNSSHPEASRVATQNMADFFQNGVTTIVWTQGYQVSHTQAAAKMPNYHPEWVVAGDGSLDGYEPNAASNGGQDASEWAHAWVMSNQGLTPATPQTQCYQAIMSADPQGGNHPSFGGSTAANTYCGNYTFYEDLRQMFTGIQVAGPRLTPQSMDQGFHAIPHISSSDPSVPACFYDPGDYTCVKDAVTMWWDSTANNLGGSPGTWRVPEGGKRFLGDGWPTVEMSSRADLAHDPPNGFRGSYFSCC